MRRLKVAVPQARVAQQAARVVLERLHLQLVARVVLRERAVLLEPVVLRQLEVQPRARPRQRELLPELFQPRAPQSPVRVL